MIITTRGAVDFAPATVVEEIVQNVRTIITTPKFTVPLDREFGIDAGLIDLPIAVAQTRLTAEIIKAVHKYEPRCEVLKVMYTEQSEDDTADGRLRPLLEVRLRGV